jgi:hypothetical protein
LRRSIRIQNVMGLNFAASMVDPIQARRVISAFIATG